MVCYVTLRCNGTCREDGYCIQMHDSCDGKDIKTGDPNIHKNFKEITPSDWIKGLNRFKGRSVALTGGEPFLYGTLQLATIVNNIGYYQWNCLDKDNKKVASGLYFVKVSNGSNSVIKKLLIVR